MPAELECIGWTACPGGFDGVCVGCPLPAVRLCGGDFSFQIPSDTFYKGAVKRKATAEPTQPTRSTSTYGEPQMPKRSRFYDRATAMVPVASKKPKKSTDIDIKPAGEVSKEYKTNMVAALVRDGKVRMTRSCDFSKKS